MGIEISGADQVKRRLTELSRSASDTMAIHRRIGIALVAWGQRNFRSGGSERAWAPLNPSTIAGRRGGSSLPLRDTGKLQQSFLEFDATAERVRWGSLGDEAIRTIAGFHHYGTAGPYEIKPKTKKALAFPHPGGQKLSAGTRKKLLGAERQGKFTSFRMRGRSRRSFSSLPFLVVKKVMHPGLPARPLLPSDALAQEIAIEQTTNYINESVRK